MENCTNNSDRLEVPDSLSLSLMMQKCNGPNNAQTGDYLFDLANSDPGNDSQEFHDFDLELRENNFAGLRSKSKLDVVDFLIEDSDSFQSKNQINFDFSDSANTARLKNDTNGLSVLSPVNSNCDFTSQNNRDSSFSIQSNFNNQTGEYEEEEEVMFDEDFELDEFDQDQDEEEEEIESVIKIDEEDLVDERATLRQIFKDEFFDKCDCVCDTSQGSFTSKRGKFSKSMQRKLVKYWLFQFKLYRDIYLYLVKPFLNLNCIVCISFSIINRCI
jgi:hypothetical protein